MSDEVRELEQRIQEALDRGVEGLPPPAPLDRHLRRRVLKGATSFIVSRVVIAALVVAAASVAVLELRGGGATPAPEVPAAPSTTVPEGVLVFASLVDPEHGDSQFYRVDLPGGDPSVLAGVDGYELDLSPDGTKLAYTRSLGPYLGELWVLDLSTGESRRIVRDLGTVSGPSWHPDGRDIAFATQSYVTDPTIPIRSIYSVRDDGEHLRLLAEPEEGALEVDWSSDGNRLAYSAIAHADIRVLDLRTGETATVWDHRDGEAHSLSWAPDGASIAISVSDRVDGTSAIFSVSSDPPFERRRLTPASFLGAGDPAWSSAGNALFFQGRTAPNDDFDIFVLDLDTGDVTLVAVTEANDERPSFVSI